MPTRFLNNHLLTLPIKKRREEGYETHSLRPTTKRTSTPMAMPNNAMARKALSMMGAHHIKQGTTDIAEGCLDL